MQIGHIVVVILVRGIQLHVKVAAVDTSLFRTRHRNREPFKRELREHLEQALLRGFAAQVQQRRNEHVARDSRLAIQIERLAATRICRIYWHIHVTPPGLNHKRFSPTLPQRMRPANELPHVNRPCPSSRHRHAQHDNPMHAWYALRHHLHATRHR